MSVATQETGVRVEVESEIVALDRPARVLVYANDQLVAEVIIKVEPQQGADGGYYNCVKFLVPSTKKAE